MVQDFSNVRFDKVNLSSFLGSDISATEKAKLNTIFDECNTDTDEKGQIDDVLTGKERSNFLSRVKSEIPKLYQKIVDFFTIVDVKEDLEKTQAETIKEVNQTQKEEKKAIMDAKLKKMFDEASRANETKEAELLEQKELELQKEKEDLEKSLRDNQ